jgi:nucleoside-diphosphate-sugar epimerase
MGRSILITGASGFLGGRLLKQLAGAADRVVCLGRRKPPADASNVEFIGGDLLDRESCRRALKGCNVVLHLAAATGKHRPEEYFRVNRGGSEMILQQAKEAGIEWFCYVSTIATKFHNRFRYYYAESKQQAEELVRASGLKWTIVRPTMIFGPGSPVQEGLRRMALLPIVPIFGDGSVPVQPVFVDDAANVIAGLLDRSAAGGQTVEIGGPEVLSLEELLLRMRRAAGVGNGRVVHLPVGPIAACLAAVEPILRPVMPITAGQLASFVNPGTAAPDPYVTSWQTSMRPIDEMLS